MIFAKFAALAADNQSEIDFFGFYSSTDVTTATKFYWFYQLSSHDIR